MTKPAPINVSVTDAEGEEIFARSIPFVIGMSARDALEQAYVLSQTNLKPDPFAVTFAYFGYSCIADYPGYLGYEVESFGSDMEHLHPTNTQFYWELFIDDQVAAVGCDLAKPKPGGSLRWVYTELDKVTSPSLRANWHAQRLANSTRK